MHCTCQLLRAAAGKIAQALFIGSQPLGPPWVALRRKVGIRHPYRISAVVLLVVLVVFVGFVQQVLVGVVLVVTLFHLVGSLLIAVGHGFALPR